ncbi:hypothetical protein [Mesorhizobium sp. WSM2239]|uniref:Uncharacterized protein n=2 Tax=unclassified Mesorhizobium TaxID=325217 RepID=A0AAU8D0X6_9HYPH
MGIPATFEGFNRRFTAPEGRDDVQDLVAFTNGTCVVSAWQLTAEEVAEINRNGGKIFVSVMSGEGFFPTLVGSSETIRGMLLDYGHTIPKQPEEIIT